MTAARLPPALSPPTTTRRASPPSVVRVVRRPLGRRRRRPRPPRATGAPAPADRPPKSQRRECDWRYRGTRPSWLSRSQNTNPPPWAYTSIGRRPSPCGPVDPYRDVAAGPRIRPSSRTSATGSGSGGGTNRDRMVARACAPVMVCTGGKPGVQRLDQRGDLWVEAHAYCRAGRATGAGRRGSNGRSGCRVGATRCGPSSTLRQMPIAVIRTGAASR